MTALYCYLLIINALGLVLMHQDKKRAFKNHWRIPEYVLLTVAALGGSLGILLGMRLFRHKTRKPLFSLGISLFLCLHFLLLLYTHTV